MLSIGSGFLLDLNTDSNCEVPTFEFEHISHLMKEFESKKLEIQTFSLKPILELPMLEQYEKFLIAGIPGKFRRPITTSNNRTGIIWD